MPAAKPILIPLLAALLLCLAPVPALPAALREGRSDGPGKEKKEVRLLFAGDILLSRGVENPLSRSPQSFVAALRSVFSGADWIAGNLEGAVGSAEDCAAAPISSPFPHKAPCFSIRGEHIAFLRRIGFSAMSMENNHSLDLGPAGRQATRDALVLNDLTPLTYESSPRFIPFEDFTVGLLTLSVAGGRGNSHGEPDLVDLRRRMRLARNLAEYVIVSIHWGSEFLDWPDERQRRMAHWLIKTGADVIVGHHPHVVQKPESLDGKPVFFSLGNLLFDQRFAATKEGLLADCRFWGDTGRCSAIKTHTGASSVVPSMGETDTEAEKTLSGCVLRAGHPLTVNGIVLKPGKDSMRKGESGLVLEAEDKGKTLWKSQRAVIVSIEKMRVEGPKGARHREEVLFTLERHYSSLDGEAGLRPCVYEVRPDGLVPRWRGTALAWPLKDAASLPGEDGILCALHRGDSFLMLQPESQKERVAVYRWNGFGFSGIDDPEPARQCRDLFAQYSWYMKDAPN